jgi:hypothetical protein
MLIAHRRYRLLRTGLLQFAALVLATGCVVTAPSARTDPGEDYVDPPARVGRIALLSGPVTLTDLRDGDAEAATLNWPITSQHRLSTGRFGRAEVRLGSVAVRLDDETDVDFNRVDDEVIQIVVQRGTAALRVRNRELLREIDLLTPRERIAFEDVGRYRIDVDRAAGITAVTAHVGYARISAGRNAFVVQSGQRGEVGSYPMVSFQLVAPAPDSFDDWVASRDRRDDAVRSRHYVSEETTGIESLDEYGQWRTVESYGPVWFPSGVPAGWAPYRYGRWAWIAPWGWTWIDEAPWGFAPFHYGRWVIVGGVWGWVPGVIVPRPVYAPALVVWLGAPGVSVGVTIGSPVGWFPLGPREIYIPYYRCSRRHINYLNVQHITNINHITVINPPPRYVHQQPGHSTWTLGDALLRRMPVHNVVRPAPNDWVRIPTRTAPPVVVSGDASKKRLVGNAIAAPAPGPRDAGGRPDRRGGEQHVRPQPREIAPPAIERRPDGDRVRAMPAPQPRHELPPKRVQPPVAVPAQPPVAVPAQPAPSVPGPRGVEPEPRQPPKRFMPVPPDSIRGAPPPAYVPAPGGRSQPRVDAPRLEQPRVAPPRAEPPREQVRPQPKERGPVEGAPRPKSPVEQSRHEGRGKLQARAD